MLAPRVPPFGAALSVTRGAKIRQGSRQCGSRRSELPVRPRWWLCSLPAGEKFAHTVEGTQNVFGRIGIAEPHIALPQNAEVRPADNGDTCVLQQGGGKRLCLPAGALDIGERIER